MVAAVQLHGGSNPFRKAWRSYNSVLTKNPLLARSLTSAIGHFVGDVMGQMCEKAATKGRKKFDSARLARMTAFGMFCNGPWAHYWYHYLDKYYFPSRMTQPLVVVSKAIIDQAINAPVGTVMFYAFITALENKFHLINAVIQEKTMPTLYANWKVWPTVHVINFALIPPRQRILYINCVALFWRAFLSVYGNNRKCVSEDEMKVAVGSNNAGSANVVVIQADANLVTGRK